MPWNAQNCLKVVLAVWPLTVGEKFQFWSSILKFTHLEFLLAKPVEISLAMFQSVYCGKNKLESRPQILNEMLVSCFFRGWRPVLIPAIRGVKPVFQALPGINPSLPCVINFFILFTSLLESTTTRVEKSYVNHTVFLYSRFSGVLPMYINWFHEGLHWLPEKNTLPKRDRPLP